MIKNKGIDQSPVNKVPARGRWDKVGLILVFISLIVIGLGIGRLLTWSLASEDILEVKNEPFPVRTIREHPTAAGVVILKVEACKNTETIGRVRTSFVSESREVFLPVFEDRGSRQCFESEVPVLIPKDLPPGKYKVHFRVAYDINPIKKDVLQEFESKEFEVFLE